VTVFMSSHILAEVSRLANRIGIIHEGRLIQEMDTLELEHDRRRQLLVNVHDLEAARSTLVAAGHTLKFTSDGAIILNDPAALDRPDDIATLLVQSKNPPTRLNLEQEDLEQYFLRLVGLEKWDGMGEKVSVDGGIQ
jgi:ABC-2 type transport system ATP-binding protein